MDEKEKKELELNLEDILREFGSDPGEMLDEAVSEMPIAQEPPLEERLKAFLEPEEVQAVSEEIPEEAVEEDEDVKEFIPSEKKSVTTNTLRVDPRELMKGDKNRPVPMGQTQRFEPIGGEVQPEFLQGGTIRFEPLKEKEKPEVTLEGTQRFEAIGEEAPPEQESLEAPPEELPEGAELFSEAWEPQYEQPMGEYVPPEPIVFRPRSRLHELKRKLIAGPERRYYALSEQGLGKLQAGMFLSVLVVILAVAALGLHSVGMVQPNRMRLLVFGELFAVMLSALLASHRLVDGLAGLFRLKFTPDTMLALAFCVCLADGFLCLREVRVPFCAAFCLMVTCSLWAEYQRRNVEMGQMDTLRKAVRLNRVAKAPDCYEGLPGFYTWDGEVEDFMDTYTQPATPDRIISIYCLAAFLGTMVIAAVAGFSKGVSVGLQTWSAALLAAMPMTIFVCQTRPMAVLERRLHKLGVVLCGWQGVKEMSGAAAIALNDTDLFPAGSVKINGVKFYTHREPDQVVGYATAVMDRADNALTPLFLQLLESRNAIRYEAEEYRTYENGGLGAVVNGESVLLGTVSFLQEMGVEIPEGTKVNQAVYVAVDGELCGVFALAYGKLKGVAAGLGTLCGYRGLTPVIASDNFLINEGFIRGKFGVNTRRVAFPTGESRRAVAAWVPDMENSVPCALTTQDGLAPTAYAITGARALRTACNLGMAVHMLAGIAGMVMVLVLTMVGADTLLTPLNLLLLHLVWAGPGLLVSGWTRHI